jgi:RNA polymerase sigma-70 factor (ECF subfamily)
MNAESSDRDLLRRAASDSAAFEVFYRRHIDRVVGFTARRVREPADVADLVATTFLTVLTSAQKYDPARGEPTAWLLGITAKLIANGTRRKGRESAAIAKIVGRELIDSNDTERIEELIDASRSTEVVVRALGELKPRWREALLLVGDEELTPQEAARVLGISAAAFRMRLTVARRALETRISEMDRRPEVSKASAGDSCSSSSTSHNKPNLKEVNL